VKAVLLPPDTPAEERAAFEARLLEEARRASQLSHPGLVAIHDCGKDAATGALKWATEGRAADQAAILLTPAHVLVLTTGGELVLVRRSPAKYDEERRYTVADSATWAVPVLLPDGLILRDASGVMRLTS
jgi:hypothetical protein